MGLCSSQTHQNSSNPDVSVLLEENEYLRAEVQRLQAELNKRDIGTCMPPSGTMMEVVSSIPGQRSYISGGINSFPLRFVGDGQWWEVRDYGDIGIGPGSYYCNDETISVDKHFSFPSEEEVIAWAREFERERDGIWNPVVMLEYPPGDSIIVRAHRLKFMFQNLDGETGQTPLHFVDTVCGYVKEGPNVLEREGVRVLVASDAWFAEAKSRVRTNPGLLGVTVPPGVAVAEEVPSNDRQGGGKISSLFKP